MALSNLSTFSLEEVAAVSNAGRWFRLYLTVDRTINEKLVRAAEAAGYEAIVLTVDNVAGLKSGSGKESQVPMAARERAFWSTGYADPQRALRIFTALPDPPRVESLVELIDPAPSWADVGWLASITQLPIMGAQIVVEPELSTLASEPSATCRQTHCNGLPTRIRVSRSTEWAASGLPARWLPRTRAELTSRTTLGLPATAARGKT
jgi:hypothetical protein